MKQNSLKSLKVVARFFSYVSAGHEAGVSDEGSVGKKYVNLSSWFEGKRYQVYKK